MHHYLITIVMSDGSRGHCRARFKTDWDAIEAMLDAFHDARQISARRQA